MILRQKLVGLAALATAMIGIAQQGGQAVPTIHMGTMDFTTGTLIVPETGSSKAVPGFSPLWNADGTRLVYLSRMRDSGGIRATLNVESIGTTREVVSDVSIGGAMSVTLDPDIILIEGTNRNAESGVFQIDLRTGKSMMVAANARASFVSGDGRHLYFFRGEGAHHELVEHDFSTRRERPLVRYEHAPEIPESAYVSPDRTRVYYRMPDAGAKAPEPESHIVERDLASGHERTLLSGRLGHLRPSPDGRHAVVRQNDPSGQWVAIRLLPLVDDRPTPDLMRAEGNAALFFSFWSPDSRSVILQMPDSGRPTSWWVPLYGQPQKALSRFVGSAAVHPNGKTIAFAANDK
jgi:Tol biopolymer transport system component